MSDAWLRNVTTLILSVIVTALSLAVYDRLVRQPQTPRLALVDVNAIYGAAQREATRGALAMVERGRSDTVTEPVAAAALSQVEKVAGEFGPRLDKALKTLSGECQCVVVALSAVHGQDAGIPDYTALVAERLGVELGS